jgi:predicted HAD superfamily Cof-like phosphohydrolase
MKKAKKTEKKTVKRIKVKRVKHTSRLMKDIEAFHQKFGRKPLKVPGIVSPAEFDFRLRFINEELDELVGAYAKQDLEGYLDALVDLTYVVLGAAYLSGAPFDKAWAQVHKANMKKKKAKTATDSSRGYACDIVKPKGWQPPDLGKILEQHGVILSAGAAEAIGKMEEGEAAAELPLDEGIGSLG